MDINTVLKFISVASNIANIGLLIGLLVQLGFIYKQLKTDHERSRREKALELLQWWSSIISEEMLIAKKIGETFDKTTARKVCNGEPIKLNKELFPLVQRLFEKKIKTDNNNVFQNPFRKWKGNEKEPSCDSYITLETEEVIKLRYLLIKYLNSLESVLVGWQHNIADASVLKEEFSYLFKPEAGNETLENFRIACGGEKSFPAITIFLNHLKMERENQLKRKEPVV